MPILFRSNCVLYGKRRVRRNDIHGWRAGNMVRNVTPHPLDWRRPGPVGCQARLPSLDERVIVGEQRRRGSQCGFDLRTLHRCKITGNIG
jgi:hypothetical protein